MTAGLGSARLVLATGNAHKVAELVAILSAELGTLPAGAIRAAGDFGLGDIPETEVTFEGNALLKAQHVSGQTGLPAVADDSGLIVDVLGAAPGVFSARWCGRHGDDEANVRLLLAQLADVPPAHRQARFVCAAALVEPDGREVVRVGEMRGLLLPSPRGDGGFGYDPIFQAVGQSVSNAELSAEAKNAISHRRAALRALAPDVQRVLGGKSS